MPRQVRQLRPGARPAYSGAPSFRGINCNVECDRAPGCECRGPWLAGGFRIRYARDLRPLAAGSARRDFFLAPQAALRNPPHRLGSPVAGVSSWENPGGRKGAGCGFGVPLLHLLCRRMHPPYAGKGPSRGGRHP
jgi:hypothetical protein